VGTLGVSAAETGEAALPRQQRVDQPDYSPIPATGPTPVVVGDYTPSPISDYTPSPTSDYTSAPVMDEGSAPPMDDIVAPLVEHLIAFSSVMNLLRSRQRDSAGSAAGALTPGDRSSIRSVLDQMREREGGWDDSSLTSLQARAQRLTGKVRDALENLDYQAADLFRIYGEVRSEACGLTRELENSGQVTITGLDQVRQLYECK
jgi:hypothetical protein